ncbi:hypothetical protein [Natronocalculus amylovorans]|uniref:Uncharacterized protein n=1 Tax=Natronocalculus amylovorans TaxID=2917812 RepID=A0AAE3K7D9_9EURY|nr:hypothetical protein [Natronocalculus amylovorans]MCL9815908.1 hypothetical protein [Natronocalculus amylovorans]
MVTASSDGDALHTERWRWALERLLFLIPPLIGVGIIGVLQQLGAPIISDALLLFTSVGYLVLSVGIPVCIFLDARAVSRAARESGVRRAWKPNPWLYAGFAILSAPLVGIFYLYRRHTFTQCVPGEPWWWIVIAVAVFAYLFGIVLTAIGAVLAVPAFIVAGLGLAGAIAYGLFPVALYEDTRYIRATDPQWKPNPGLYFGIAFLSLFIAILQPIVAISYLIIRHRELGVP